MAQSPSPSPLIVPPPALPEVDLVAPVIGDYPVTGYAVGDTVWFVDAERPLLEGIVLLVKGDTICWLDAEEPFLPDLFAWIP